MTPSCIPGRPSASLFMCRSKTYHRPAQHHVYASFLLSGNLCPGMGWHMVMGNTMTSTTAVPICPEHSMSTCVHQPSAEHVFTF